MVARLAKTGKFLACSGYPECKSTINIPDEVMLFSAGIPVGPIKMKELIQEIQKETPPDLEPAGEICDKCGAEMIFRNGRFGRFIACSKYPECKNTRQVVVEIGISCPEENCDGKILEKKSKRGRLFYGCSKYPECEFTTWARPTGELCPDCKAPLVQHSTKKLGPHIKCSAKGCKYKKFPEGEDNDEQKD
jgi:DNA topoisomerase-1